MINKFFIIVAMASVFTSCVSVDRMSYVQSESKTKTAENEQIYFIGESQETVIGPDDEIYIRVTSSDEEANTLTNSQVSINEPYLLSYSVDKQGYILLPLVGKLKFGGLTVEEATDTLENLFTQYLYLPSVYMKIINKKITIPGEVNNPGVYSFYNKNISILQAIGYANDITTYGNRKRVMIMRENGNEVSKKYLDLTSDNLITSAYYYVQPDDIIFCAATWKKKWGLNNTVPINMVLGLVSTTLLILTYSNTVANAN